MLLNQFRYKIVHLAGKKNSAADSISRTINLQTDPLTAHENERFHVDDATDLRLDLTDKAYTDTGTQCDLLKIIKTFNENDVWPVMNITDWNMQPPLPQRRARVRSADRADERTPERSCSGQAPAGEYTPSGSGACAATSVREAVECTSDSEGPGSSHSESACSGASLPALARQPGLQTDVNFASSTAARSADRTGPPELPGTVSPSRTHTPAVQVNSPRAEIAGAVDDTPTGPTEDRKNRLTVTSECVLLLERAGTNGAGLAEYTDTESDSAENRLRAWPAGAGGERGKVPRKSISSDAACAGARTACIADYSGDHADACRRPRRLSDAALAAAAECLPMRGTTDNDRSAVADRQQDTGNVRHARADAATNRFEADSADLQVDTENKSSTPQNDRKHHISEVNLFAHDKCKPAPSPSANVIVNGADARGGTPTADEDGDRRPSADD